MSSYLSVIAFFKSIIISLGSFSIFLISSSCLDFSAFLFLSNPIKFFLYFFLRAFQYSSLSNVSLSRLTSVLFDKVDDDFLSSSACSSFTLDVKFDCYFLRSSFFYSGLLTSACETLEDLFYFT